MNEYISVLKKYAVFSGRAGRREFWMFVLFNVIISFVLSLIDGVIGISVAQMGLLSFIYSLLVILPTLAVSVRRLHDIGRSWLSLFFALIPFAGPIILIVFYAKGGDAGDNKFGKPAAKATA